MKTARRVLALAVASGLLLVAAPSRAQQAGYASNAFNPSERGSQWFVLDSLDMRGSGRLALGMVHDYSYRSLVHYAPDDSVDASVVRNQYVLHMGGAITFADRFRFGMNVPLQLFADGHSATINGVAHRPAEDVSVGDVRVSGDVRLFGKYGDAITTSVGAELFLPSGARDSYVGDGEPRILPRVLVAGQASMFAYSAKAGFMIRTRDEAWGDSYIGNSLVYAASAGAVLADKKLVVGPEIFGSTVVQDGRAFEARSTPLDLLLGVHYDVGADLRIGAGIGTALTRGYGAAVARGLLSIEWVPGNPPPEVAKAEEKADRDGDGVPDCVDACSWVKGPASDVPEKNGCPPPDADRDGVPDDVDACPTRPGIATPDAKTNGCPADGDGDGVPDDEDACPKESGKRSTDPSQNGCPDRDRDKDGISDAEDACPDTAGVKSTDPKTNGCPNPDRDGDGIANDVDACPDQAGKADPDPKKNGCPKAFLEGKVIRITEQVRFKTASAEIVGKESQDVLDAVLAVVKAHPEIPRLIVEGHTDDRGNAANNKALSQKRAESVTAWLSSHGVEKGRLTATGFGAEKPIDTNSTEEGRTKNRRVEFHVEQGSGR